MTRRAYYCLTYTRHDALTRALEAMCTEREYTYWYPRQDPTLTVLCIAPGSGRALGTIRALTEQHGVTPKITLHSGKEESGDPV